MAFTVKSIEPEKKKPGSGCYYVSTGEYIGAGPHQRLVCPNDPGKTRTLGDVAKEEADRRKREAAKSGGAAAQAEGLDAAARQAAAIKALRGNK